MDDEDEAIVLIIGSDTDTCNLFESQFKRQHSDFFEVPVIKQEHIDSDYNNLALNELLASVQEQTDGSDKQSLHIKKEIFQTEAKEILPSDEFEILNSNHNLDLTELLATVQDQNEGTDGHYIVIKGELESEENYKLGSNKNIFLNADEVTNEYIENSEIIKFLEETDYGYTPEPPVERKLPVFPVEEKAPVVIDENNAPVFVEENKAPVPIGENKAHVLIGERKNGRRFNRSLSEHKSFVNELRKQSPELKEDEELLILTLANIMKEIKVPQPPDNCFELIGNEFKCTFCDRVTSTKWAIHKHYQETHGERYLSCFACGTEFRSITGLYKHEKRCMNIDAVLVLKARAKMIGDNARNRPYLEKKRIVFTGNKKTTYLCSECPAEFTSKGSLESHQFLHRGIRPFRCSVCTAAYTSKTSLTKHLKRHSSDRYICDICDKSFKIKDCLIYHLDTHLPEKKYGCEECGKRYTTKKMVEVHVATKHRNEPNPHACQVCSKSFVRMSTFKDHMKQKHGMTIITRRMLIKQLPMLSDEQVQEAKHMLNGATVNT